MNLFPGHVLDFIWLTSTYQLVSCDGLLLNVEDR